MTAPSDHPFEYGVLRFVPRVERGEFINIGVVVICRTRRYLQAMIELDRARMSALFPSLDDRAWSAVVEAVKVIPAICAGDPAGGPIARLSIAERWHWLVAPSSTRIQAGPAHTGITADPQETLERIFAEQVS